MNSDLFNGHEFSPLSGTEFHQMTGRAGRRGQDRVGFMLVVPGRFMDLIHIRKLLSRKPEAITSRIRSDFSMILNLLLSQTPEDIREIAGTGGVVGLMMSYQGTSDPQTTTGVESMLAAIDYLVQHGGEEVVAFGSDFDGNFAVLPEDVKSPRGYDRLREAMFRKYTEDQVAKFMSGNAERVLRDGWGK